MTETLFRLSGVMATPNASRRWSGSVTVDSVSVGPRQLKYSVLLLPVELKESSCTQSLSPLPSSGLLVRRDWAEAVGLNWCGKTPEADVSRGLVGMGGLYFSSLDDSTIKY